MRGGLPQRDDGGCGGDTVTCGFGHAQSLVSTSPWLGTRTHVSKATYGEFVALHRCAARGREGGGAQPKPWGAELGACHPSLSLSVGVYVQEMADAGTAKLYAGLLGVGDEILQVNGVAVSGLGLARIRDLLLQADTLSLRVLRHRPPPR